MRRVGQVYCQCPVPPCSKTAHTQTDMLGADDRGGRCFHARLLSLPGGHQLLAWTCLWVTPQSGSAQVLLEMERHRCHVRLCSRGRASGRGGERQKRSPAASRCSGSNQGAPSERRQEQNRRSPASEPQPAERPRERCWKTGCRWRQKEAPRVSRQTREGSRPCNRASPGGSTGGTGAACGTASQNDCQSPANWRPARWPPPSLPAHAHSRDRQRAERQPASSPASSSAFDAPPIRISPPPPRHALPPSPCNEFGSL